MWGTGLKLRERRRHEITRKMQALVVPFAQNDMVYRFMEGIDKTYSDFLKGSMSALIELKACAVADEYLADSPLLENIKNDIRQACREEFDEFVKLATMYRQETFSEPIIQMVTRLPKEELANMAESLVNLTSLKRRISIDRETVGGPIDVAVISKGDGFIWIKRKHYFDADRNPSFFRNYFNELKGDGHATKKVGNTKARSKAKQ